MTVPTDAGPVRIAVIADAHFHDVLGDFGVPGVITSEGRMTLRTLADTARAPRLVNEGGDALRHALTDIAARGIRTVVLLGDYSDDGQSASVTGLRGLLAGFTARHGVRFYATPGNHDMFGSAGRHRTRRYASASGGYDLATSDPHVTDGGARRIGVSRGMYCQGVPDAVSNLAELGFLPQRADLHWESPFGTSGDLTGRTFSIAPPGGGRERQFVDASYLVEPVPGLWLLMMDCNVFVPLLGEEASRFDDPGDAGWNAMLRHKRFVLTWAADVAERAARTGRRLLAFSHYPALDPLRGTVEDERALLGQTAMVRRIPAPDVAGALLRSGIRVHFSGHLHVNDTARHTGDQGFLVNISVPSLVAFPAAYKIATLIGDDLHIETAGVDAMPLSPAIMSFYRAEADAGGGGADHLLAHEAYGPFLDAHLMHLVGRRYLRREWPADTAARMKGQSLRGPAERGLAAQAADDIPALTFLQDWYRVRLGSHLGLAAIPPSRLKIYGILAQQSAQDPADRNAPDIMRVLSMFTRYIGGLPSADFTVDLHSGSVRPE